MTIVCDTNILSSLAAANALALLQQLFVRSMLSIPRQLITRVEVEHLISRMEQVERLTLSEEQRAAIFAPRRRRR